MAGSVATVLQQTVLTPLILQAEALEVAHDHAADAWAPETGLERAAFTLLFNCLAGVGFGLLLSAALALRGNLTAGRGMLWGLAGFVSFSLAPALGLPPELPGVHAADLFARQLWWIATAIATAGGLACLGFGRWPVKLAGGALLAIPHLIGAPSVPGDSGSGSGEVAHAFTIGSLAISAAFWLVLGAVVAWRVVMQANAVDDNPS